MEESINPTFRLLRFKTLIKEGTYDEVWECLEEKSRIYGQGILTLLTLGGYELINLQEDPVHYIKS